MFIMIDGDEILSEAFCFLPTYEALPLKLRAIYESAGYSKYRMEKFLPYDLYIEHKEFLTGDGIITFTDALGRLMALKPDVTIGIAKNADDGGAAEKVYYDESIFRIDEALSEYREISQIGLEYIGADTAFAEAEVVIMALESLEAISPECVLDISHMGYISELLTSLGIEGRDASEAMRALKSKDRGALKALAEKLELGEAAAEKLDKVSRFRLSLGEAARLLSGGDGPEETLSGLAALSAAVSARGGEEKVFVDFSVINGLDYYNGLVFQGYVKGAPRAILSGGRYDNLMKRLGKPQRAIGFAIYLTELDRIMYEPREFDVDVLLVYGDAPPEDVVREAEKLRRGGESVRAEKSAECKVRARRTVSLGGEVSRDA